MSRYKEQKMCAASTAEIFILGVKVEVDFEADITITDQGDPGKTYGPPENCWPPESAEFEFDGPIKVYLPGDYVIEANWSDITEPNSEILERAVKEYVDNWGT